MTKTPANRIKEQWNPPNENRFPISPRGTAPPPREKSSKKPRKQLSSRRRKRRRPPVLSGRWVKEGGRWGEGGQGRLPINPYRENETSKNVFTLATCNVLLANETFSRWNNNGNPMARSKLIGMYCIFVCDIQWIILLIFNSGKRLLQQTPYFLQNFLLSNLSKKRYRHKFPSGRRHFMYTRSVGKILGCDHD